MLEGLDKKLNKLISDITILKSQIEEQKPKEKKNEPDTIFWSGFHWMKYDDE